MSITWWLQWWEEERRRKRRRKRRKEEEEDKDNDTEEEGEEEVLQGRDAICLHVAASFELATVRFTHEDCRESCASELYLTPLRLSGASASAAAADQNTAYY